MTFHATRKRSAAAYIGVITALVAGPLALSTATGSHAATPVTRYVTKAGSDLVGADPNDCTSSATPCATVQHAIDEAESGDTVLVGAGTYAESDAVTIPLTITGASQATTVISGDNSDGPSLTIGSDTPIAVAVNKLALSGNAGVGAYLHGGSTGNLTDIAASNDGGGGILVGDTSAATVTGSDILNNGSDGIDVEGASATILDSVISSNEEAGVLVNEGTATIDKLTASVNHLGGVIVGVSAPAIATVTRSSLIANGGAGAVAGEQGALTIARSTVANSVPFPAGESTEDRFGGGLLALGGKLNAIEDTVYGNDNFGIAAATQTTHGTATVSNSTITATKHSVGSALIGGLASSDAAAAITATGTIDAGNKVQDCARHISDKGYNLAGDKTCGLSAKGSTVAKKPHLGALRKNGGPTLTVLPDFASAARNAIPLGAAGCVTKSVDQRGEPRRSPMNGKCDIGSVEAKVKNPKLHAKVSGHKHGKAYRGTVTITFKCTAKTAPLTKPCPDSTTLTSTGKHTVTKTIHAEDGGKASIKLTITIT